jgi:hypothetical protein
VYLKTVDHEASLGESLSKLEVTTTKDVLAIAMREKDVSLDLNSLSNQPSVTVEPKTFLGLEVLLLVT